MIRFKEILNGKEKLRVYFPSKMTWSLQDVSQADSGRDYEGTMYKNRVTQKRKIELEFAGLNWRDTSKLLNLINPEYIEVGYPDMLSGKWEERTFYVGDRSTPVYIWTEDKQILSSVKFDLIER